MDQELVEYLDRRFEENEDTTTRQIEALRQETHQRFERIDGEIRHTQVMVEDARSDLGRRSRIRRSRIPG